MNRKPLIYLHYFHPTPERDRKLIEELEKHLGGSTAKLAGQAAQGAIIGEFEQRPNRPEQWAIWGPGDLLSYQHKRHTIYYRQLEAAFLLAIVTPEAVIDSDWLAGIARARRKRRPVVTLLLRPAPLDGTGLEGYVSLPRDERFITTLPNPEQDLAWLHVVQELKLALRSIPPPIQRWIAPADLERVAQRVLPGPAAFTAFVRSWCQSLDNANAGGPHDLAALLARLKERGSAAPTIEVLETLQNGVPPLVTLMLRCDNGPQQDRLIPLPLDEPVELRRRNLCDMDKDYEDDSISDTYPVRISAGRSCAVLHAADRQVRLNGSSEWCTQAQIHAGDRLMIGSVLQLVVEEFPHRVKTTSY